MIFLKNTTIWLLFFILSFSLKIQAESDVKLITIGPGNAFWSAYGHTALLIDDRVYGFGYFSFEDEGLLQSFVANQMYYDIGVSDFAEELELAEWQNRTFIVQDLYFAPKQQRQISEFLEWHNLPENQSYRYDYFINNCATKIRDIIDDAWNGALQTKFNIETEESYFSQTFPAKNQSMMNFGIVLGYGWSAYQKRTAWELMAFPVYLQTKISELSTDQISQESVFFQAGSESVIATWFGTHWFLLVYVLVLFAGLMFPLTRRFTIAFIGFIQVLLGLIIVYFWLFSGHGIIHWNFNLLLFTPLVLLIGISHKFNRLILLGYLVWLLLALYLTAVYFLPVCLLHVYWLHLSTSNQQV